jgi:hypothetical protein
MAIGSGLGSQLGFVNEVTYGTYVAPTKFVRADSWSIVKVSNRVQGAGIQTGTLGELASQYAQTTEAATAQFACAVHPRSMGLLFQALMGTSVTPVQQGATAAYLQTHTLADPVGKFLTVQGGVPYRSGTVQAKSLRGGRVTKAEFSCGIDEVLQSSWEVDGRQFDAGQSLAAASYAAPTNLNLFHFGQMAVKLGTFGAEASVAGVRSVSASIERPLDVGDFTAGAAGLKAEPVLNDRTKITGSVSADYLDKAVFEDRYHGMTSTSLVWEFVGPLIASTFYETWRLTVPGIFFTGETVGADGPGEVVSEWPWEWKYDGTNLPKIEYISLDATL